MQPADYALIVVKDNGAGIDNENIKGYLSLFYY